MALSSDDKKCWDPEKVAACPNSNNVRRSKSSSLTVTVCFLLILCFTLMGFLVMHRKSSVHILNIYIFTSRNESLAKILPRVSLQNSSRDYMPFTTEPSRFTTCSAMADLDKFDCFPDAPVTEQLCLQRGCCYKALSENHDRMPSKAGSFPPLNTPYCFYPSDYVGYSLKNASQDNEGVTAILQREIPSGFPHDAQELKLTVSSIDEKILRIKLTDLNEERFEPPIAQGIVPQTVREDQKQYTVELSWDGILSVARNSTGNVIFQTDLSRLVYSNQFLQLSTELPSQYVYGLGESYDGLLKNVNWTRTTLFNHDASPKADLNLYGTHALYLALEDDGLTSGVFLLNSNAMDIILQPQPALTYRTIGGILDFFVYLGPTPDDIVQQHTQIVGRSFMPPYWSLGFHLCKYGYNSLNNTRAAWKRTREAGIPFDVQWNDIDYMETYNDFTYDKVKFDGLPEFINELHDNNMHYVMIVDPGITNTEPAGTYPPYDEGIKDDIFLKNSTGDLYIGKVWNPISTVFPDFSHPAAEVWWTRQFKTFHDVIPFDGAWIDMNEPSNFYDGTKDGCPRDSTLDNPQYLPGGLEPLATHTLCMSARHYNSTHYNEHNLYGLREAIATNHALSDITGKRPFIISRASFAGQGPYSGHWSGDISSSWEDLRYSVVDLLNFNMFGMSMMGSDICGFNGDTTVELCARWTAVGAFYPFSRNHNNLNQKDQDPAALGYVVVNAAVNTLTTRYTLLPYLYHLFYESHVYGKTVARPLFFEFPDDSNTYDIEEQFLWGSALMIMPALYPELTDMKVYFPQDIWYDYYTGEKLDVSGKEVTVQAPLDTINLALRGGYVLPQQYPNMTTVDSRLNNFKLLAGLGADKTAAGELYWDDGESLGSYENGQFNLISFRIKDNVLNSEVSHSGYATTMYLDKIKICGLNLAPANVTINGTQTQYEFDQYNCLTVSVGVSLLQRFEVIWQ